MQKSAKKQKGDKLNSCRYVGIMDQGEKNVWYKKDEGREVGTPGHYSILNRFRGSMYIF